MTQTTVGKLTEIKMFNKDKIRTWMYIHQPKITWFLIGWLTTSGIRDLFMGNYFSALISFGIAYLNYVMSS